jgi:hypothetical protein
MANVDDAVENADVNWKTAAKNTLKIVAYAGAFGAGCILGYIIGKVEGAMVGGVATELGIMKYEDFRAGSGSRNS